MSAVCLLLAGSWCWEHCPISCSWTPSPSTAVGILPQMRNRRRNTAPAARIAMMSRSLSRVPLSPQAKVPRLKQHTLHAWGVSLSPGVTQAARSSGSCARLSSNSSPSPSHHPWQISSQICSRRWLGALGGGKGRPWRNTRPACRSFRSMGVCCCPLYHCSHWAQRAAYPPAQEPPQPPALGSLSSVPRQNLDAASSQKQLPS